MGLFPASVMSFVPPAPLPDGMYQIPDGGQVALRGGQRLADRSFGSNPQRLPRPLGIQGGGPGARQPANGGILRLGRLDPP